MHQLASAFYSYAIPFCAPDVAFCGAGAGYEGEAFGEYVVAVKCFVGHGAAAATELAAYLLAFYEFAIVGGCGGGGAEFGGYEAGQVVVIDVVGYGGGDGVGDCVGHGVIVCRFWGVIVLWWP